MQHFYGRPAIVSVAFEPTPVVTGWSLGDLSDSDRCRLARFVMEDPRRGNTHRYHGPFLPPCEGCGAVVAHGGHHADCGWDAVPDTRDVRPDGPAFADIEAGYVRAERSHGKRYADYLRTHDAELRAKGYDPTPWPLSLQGNDGV
jgi:hypothetical protein